MLKVEEHFSMDLKTSMIQVVLNLDTLDYLGSHDNKRTCP